MVDYSKFDRVLKQLEEEEEEGGAPRVHVQRFEGPTQVRVGAGGAAGAAGDRHAATHNPDFSWTQTEDTVTVSFKVKKGECSAKHVDVRLDGPVLVVCAPSKARELVRGELSFGVWGDGGAVPLGHSGEEEAFQRSMEWEVRDRPHVPREDTAEARWIVVTLYKRVTVPGLVLWWPRLFKLGSVQPAGVEDRDATVGGTQEQQQRREAAQRAWQEAHEEFRRRHQRQREQDQAQDPR